MQLRIGWYIITVSWLSNHALRKSFKLFVFVQMTQMARRFGCIRSFLITICTLYWIRIIFICHWNFHFFLLLWGLTELIVFIVLYHIRLISLLYRSVQDLYLWSNWWRRTLHFWVNRRGWDHSLDCRFLSGSFLLDEPKKFGTFHLFLVHCILRSVLICSVHWKLRLIKIIDLSPLYSLRLILFSFFKKFRGYTNFVFQRRDYLKMT